MSGRNWVVATETRRLPAMVAALRRLDEAVCVLAVGPPSLPEVAAASGADEVAWIEATGPVPPEARVRAVVGAITERGARAVLAAPTPAARSLLGAVAAALHAVVVPGVLAVEADGDALVVERSALGGRLHETLVTTAPVAGLFAGPETGAPGPATRCGIDRLAADEAIDVRVESDEPVAGASAGVAEAERIVAVGRGLRSRDDLALVREFADALGAELACSMPIADDYRWLPKDRYVGRSGLQVAPRLYVAVGISGAPQHLDGVRDAKAVVAVNVDPAAPIFRRAGYGVVGDLYEVLPQLRAALSAPRSPSSEQE